jgi:3-methylfumaryl-CoA hydratase
MQTDFLNTKSQTTEICSLTMVRRVAAMLDLETDSLADGEHLPKGWHFFLLAGETRKSDLRKDGFPGLGVPIPDLGLPRLLLGGRSVCYHHPIAIGSIIEKTSFIKNIVEKTTSSGPMAIITIQHELCPLEATSPAIVETQTYILLSENKASQTVEKKISEPIVSINQLQITPDETLLFQYSALGFNSHKIHLDRNYTQNNEGLPDLVVNGGLTTLLITEFVKSNLAIEYTDIAIKHLAPLYCNKPMTITANITDNGWIIIVYDNNNNKAVEAILT